MTVDKFIRATLYADHPDDDDRDFLLVRNWIEKWGPSIKVYDYSTGGWEHLWNVEATEEALNDSPDRFRCASEWAGFD